MCIKKLTSLVIVLFGISNLAHSRPYTNRVEFKCDSTIENNDFKYFQNYWYGHLDNLSNGEFVMPTPAQCLRIINTIDKDHPGFKDDSEMLQIRKSIVKGSFFRRGVCHSLISQWMSKRLAKNCKPIMKDRDLFCEQKLLPLKNFIDDSQPSKQQCSTLIRNDSFVKRLSTNDCTTQANESYIKNTLTSCEEDQYVVTANTKKEGSVCAFDGEKTIGDVFAAVKGSSPTDSNTTDVDQPKKRGFIAGIAHFIKKHMPKRTKKEEVQPTPTLIGEMQAKLNIPAIKIEEEKVKKPSLIRRIKDKMAHYSAKRNKIDDKVINDIILEYKKNGQDISKLKAVRIAKRRGRELRPDALILAAKKQEIKDNPTGGAIELLVAKNKEDEVVNTNMKDVKKNEKKIRRKREWEARKKAVKDFFVKLKPKKLKSRKERTKTVVGGKQQVDETALINQFVTEKIVPYLDNRPECLIEEGILRKAAEESSLKDLESRVKKGEDVSLEKYDCHVTMGVMKRLIRQKATPISKDLDTVQVLFDSMIDGQEQNEMIEAANKIIERLDDEGIVLVSKLAEIFNKIIAGEAKNKMSQGNVCIVVGPLLRNIIVGQPKDPMALITDVEKEQNLCRNILNTNFSKTIESRDTSSESSDVYSGNSVSTSTEFDSIL